MQTPPANFKEEIKFKDTSKLTDTAIRTAYSVKNKLHNWENCIRNQQRHTYLHTHPCWTSWHIWTTALRVCSTRLAACMCPLACCLPNIKTFHWYCAWLLSKRDSSWRQTVSWYASAGKAIWPCHLNAWPTDSQSAFITIFCLITTLTFDLKIETVHLCPQLHLSCKSGEIPTRGL